MICSTWGEVAVYDCRLVYCSATSVINWYTSRLFAFGTVKGRLGGVENEGPYKEKKKRCR